MGIEIKSLLRPDAIGLADGGAAIGSGIERLIGGDGGKKSLIIVGKMQDAGHLLAGWTIRANI